MRSCRRSSRLYRDFAGGGEYSVSFWSFLGLADRSDMNALAEEVRLLREENSRLLSEQKLRAQQQIHDLIQKNSAPDASGAES